jgi:hypothetical protein
MARYDNANHILFSFICFSQLPRYYNYCIVPMPDHSRNTCIGHSCVYYVAQIVSSINCELYKSHVIFIKTSNIGNIIIKYDLKIIHKSNASLYIVKYFNHLAWSGCAYTHNPISVLTQQMMERKRFRIYHTC